MKITGITAQQKNHNRVNVMVDGAYRFSLDVFQLVDLGIKVGKEYSEQELVALETESQFGKVYARALEYCMMRPHSAKEVRDYLYRKTRTIKKLQRPSERAKAKGNFESKLVEIVGVPQEITTRVFDRLVEKGYVDDERFTRYWVENRNLTKGSSRRKLTAELRAKGIDSSLIERQLADSPRDEADELQKIITKKRVRYPDEQKFMQYLARQGFSFDDIKSALANED